MAANEVFYHWSEINGNPYLNKIRPEMLDPKGFVIISNSRIKGEPKGANLGTERNFVFGRDYILSKIQREFLEPLSLNSLHDLIEILEQEENDE